MPTSVTPFNMKICAQIQELATEAGKQNPVFRAAPTGIAAFNILGKTLHSLLRLIVKMKISLSSIPVGISPTAKSWRLIWRPGVGELLGVPSFCRKS
jgi:hypothetical protein